MAENELPDDWREQVERAYAVLGTKPEPEPEEPEEPEKKGPAVM